MRALRLLTALALTVSLVPALAGAQDEPPLVFEPAGQTEDRFRAVSEPELVDVEAHDGILLHARVFRPDTSAEPDWQTPVILVHSPYFNSLVMGAALVGSDRLMNLVERFTPKGYTVVLSDVRGTGHSQGCGEQDGINQQLDFGTLADYFASQPWSNGRVAGFGASYDAETQHAGAIHAPEGLTTMISVAGISGLYDVAYFDGVPLTGRGASSAAVYAPFGLDVSTNPDYLVQSRQGRVVCEPDNFVNGADPRGDMTEYWAEREFRFHTEKVEASILYVMGLSDFTVSPIAIDGWYDELDVFKRAVFGQWGHSYPNTAAAQWARDDWWDMVHAWLDHELLGLETGVTDWPDVQVQSEDNTWRAVPSFEGMGEPREIPVPDTTFTELTPVDIDLGVPDFPTQLTGQAVLEGTVTIDRPNAHFVVSLQEVRANGSTRTLTTGYLSARHSESLTEPELMVPPLEPREYRVRTYPFDKTVREDSTLRLTIAGFDDWGQPAGTAYTAELTDATLHVRVVTEPCGVVVDQRQAPRAPVPSCPGGVAGN